MMVILAFKIFKIPILKPKFNPLLKVCLSGKYVKNEGRMRGLEEEKFEGGQDGKND